MKANHDTRITRLEQRLQGQRGSGLDASTYWLDNDDGTYTRCDQQMQPLASPVSNAEMQAVARAAANENGKATACPVIYGSWGKQDPSGDLD